MAIGSEARHAKQFQLCGSSGVKVYHNDSEPSGVFGDHRARVYFIECRSDLDKSRCLLTEMAPEKKNSRIHFVLVRAPHEICGRDAELDLANARAHTARISHTRRKDRQKRRTDGIPSKSNYRLQDITETTSCTTTICQAVESSSCGQLDPFLNLATDLSLHDRELVHFYLKTMPHKLYGVSDHPHFCPVRDCSIPQLATSSVFVEWVMFVAEVMILQAGQVDPYKGKVAVITRRISNYRHLRELMSESGDWTDDSTVYALVSAAFGEASTGDFATARRHTRAAVEILRQRRGLGTIQSMTFSEGCIILFALVSIGVPLLQYREEMEAAYERFENNVRMFGNVAIDATLLRGLRQYLMPKDSAQWSSEMANLYLLVSTLSRCNETDGKEFVMRLEMMIIGSQGSGSLSPLGIFFMICSCAERMSWWNTQHDNPFRSWEAVELVALTTAAPFARHRVLEYLSMNFLVGGKQNLLDMQIIQNEVSETWDMELSRCQDADPLLGQIVEGARVVL